MNLTVGDQVSNGITTYTILKVNTSERYYHVITHYLTTAKLKFDTVDNRYMYCGHIDLDKFLDFISNKDFIINKDFKKLFIDKLFNKEELELNESIRSVIR